MKKEKIVQSIISDSERMTTKIKELPWSIGIHAFSVILLLILLDLILGAFLFYKYIYLIKNQNPVVINNQNILIEEKKYQQILDEWKKREETFNGVEQEEIQSPFK